MKPRAPENALVLRDPEAPPRLAAVDAHYVVGNVLDDGPGSRRPGGRPPSRPSPRPRRRGRRHGRWTRSGPDPTEPARRGERRRGPRHRSVAPDAPQERRVEMRIGRRLEVDDLGAVEAQDGLDGGRRGHPRAACRGRCRRDRRDRREASLRGDDAIAAAALYTGHSASWTTAMARRTSTFAPARSGIARV
jgi:hypothetical protein